MSSRRRTYSGLEGWLMSGEVLYCGSLESKYTSGGLTGASRNIVYNITDLIPESYISNDSLLVFQLTYPVYQVGTGQSYGTRYVDISEVTIKIHSSKLIEFSNRYYDGTTGAQFQSDARNGKFYGGDNYSGWITAVNGVIRVTTLRDGTLTSSSHPNLLLIAIPRTDI